MTASDRGSLAMAWTTPDGSGDGVAARLFDIGLINVWESCQQVLDVDPLAVSGEYAVDLDGDAGPLEPISAYCDMTTEGGGWLLIAYHHDNAPLVETETVTPSGYGVMRAERWRAARDAMTNGMMFIDEFGRVSRISKGKLVTGNCTSVTNVEALHWRLWHYENSGCSGSGLDYSEILLYYAGSRGGNGASLYQYSSVKFDVWPYSGSVSYGQQNELLYFIK